MNRIVFFSFNIFLASAMFLLYASVDYQYSGADTVFLENELMRKKVEQVELKNQITQFRFDQFRQEVAEALPETLKKVKGNEESFPLRSLASVSSKVKDSPLQKKMGQVSFIKGQRLFAAGKFNGAIAALERYIEDHSYSKDVVKAYAMLVEAYYQTGKLKKSVKSTEAMVDQFPHDELTGFAMIRLGTILKHQERSDEAGQVFMTVMQTFKTNKSLRTQARKLLRKL